MAGSDDVISAMEDRHRDLINLLDAENEVSLRSSVDNDFRKALTLSAASYFETRVLDIVREFCRSVSRGNPEINALIARKALFRQYHALFDWDSNNANKFLSLFGADFKEAVAREISVDSGLAEDVRAFIRLGALRNGLVHENYATYYLDKTTPELLALYVSAKRFVDYLEAVFERTANELEAGS